MLGDVAVAVNSKDQRYADLVGLELEHPFIKDRKMIVITDDELVDMSFGTGAVKITPAHDPNDFLCGKRNNLQFINILNSDGTVNENGGIFKGMPRYLVREKIIEELQKLGLFKGKKKNQMTL
jgi:valyl-tRNA synthetase